MTTEIAPASDGAVSLAGRCRLTPRGLVAPDDLTFEEFEHELIPALRVVHSGVLWAWGDAIRLAESKWGEKYTQAVAASDYADDTLRQAVWVSGVFPDLCNRLHKLPWAHYREVATDDLTDEDRRDLLVAAEAGGWTRSQLKAAKRTYLSLRSLEGIQAVPDGGRYEVYEGDIREAGKEIAPDSIDVIVTDPPYPAEYLPLYDDLAELADRVLVPGGSLVCMIGQSYVPDLLRRLLRDGSRLHYHWTAAYLTPGGQAVQLWDRKVNTFWKPLLWLVKGAYSGDWIGDVCRSAVNDNDKRHHEWGQSESGMTDVIERFTRKGDLVLDPFMGAGTTGVAAIRLERRFIGIDVDAAKVEIARRRLAQEEAAHDE